MILSNFSVLGTWQPVGAGTGQMERGQQLFPGGPHRRPRIVHRRPRIQFAKILRRGHRFVQVIIGG